MSLLADLRITALKKLNISTNDCTAIVNLMVKLKLVVEVEDRVEDRNYLLLT